MTRSGPSSDGRKIEEIIDLPINERSTSLATLDLLIRVEVPAFFAIVNLICRCCLQGGQL